MTDTDLAVMECRGDFWRMFEEALQQCGGCSNPDIWKDSRFEEVVNILAQNGIWMVYLPECHVTSIYPDA